MAVESGRARSPRTPAGGTLVDGFQRHFEPTADLPALVPAANWTSLEHLEELPEQQEVLSDYRIGRELENRDVMRRIVKSSGDVQVVCIVQIAAGECMNGLDVT